jgi:hypothetical protein
VNDQIRTPRWVLVFWSWRSWQFSGGYFQSEECEEVCWFLHLGPFEVCLWKKPSLEKAT